jgi:hypothetical protein
MHSLLQNEDEQSWALASRPTSLLSSLIHSPDPSRDPSEFHMLIFLLSARGTILTTEDINHVDPEPTRKGSGVLSTKNPRPSDNAGWSLCRHRSSTKLRICSTDAQSARTSTAGRWTWICEGSTLKTGVLSARAGPPPCEYGPSQLGPRDTVPSRSRLSTIRRNGRIHTNLPIRDRDREPILDGRKILLCPHEHSKLRQRQSASWKHQRSAHERSQSRDCPPNCGYRTNTILPHDQSRPPVDHQAHFPSPTDVCRLRPGR